MRKCHKCSYPVYGSDCPKCGATLAYSLSNQLLQEKQDIESALRGLANEIAERRKELEVKCRLAGLCTAEEIRQWADRQEGEWRAALENIMERKWALEDKASALKGKAWCEIMRSAGLKPITAEMTRWREARSILGFSSRSASAAVAPGTEECSGANKPEPLSCQSPNKPAKRGNPTKDAENTVIGNALLAVKEDILVPLFYVTLLLLAVLVLRFPTKSTLNETAGRRQQTEPLAKTDPPSSEPAGPAPEKLCTGKYQPPSVEPLVHGSPVPNVHPKAAASALPPLTREQIAMLRTRRPVRKPVMQRADEALRRYPTRTMLGYTWGGEGMRYFEVENKHRPW